MVCTVKGRICALSSSSLPLPQKSVLCSHLEFVSSGKNHFGGKSLDAVYAVEGSICALYFLAPFCVPKVSLPLNLKLCFVLEGSGKRSPILVLVWIFALLRNFQMASLAFFCPFPTHHCSLNSWNVREFPRICVCQICRFSTNRGASGIRCAGHVPPSPDLRPFALSFIWEFLLTGLRPCFSA